MPRQDEREKHERILVEEYMKEKQLQSVLNDTINQVVKERPDDPFTLLSTLLAMHSNAKKGIQYVSGKMVLDGMGMPTIEVAVTTDKGVFTASVPSTLPGKYDTPTEQEDKEAGGDDLNTDESPPPYNGKSFNRIMDQLSELCLHKLEGANPCEQEKLDELLTSMVHDLGENVVMAMSMAICKAAAKAKEMTIYEYVASLADVSPDNLTIPVPLFSLVNGGDYGSNKLFVRDILLIPTTATTFEDALRVGVEAKMKLDEALVARGRGNTNHGLFGGVAPLFQNMNEALQMTHDIVRETAEFIRPFPEIAIGLDVSANGFTLSRGAEGKGPFLYNPEKWNESSKEQRKTSLDMSTIYEEWVHVYNVKTLVDPFNADDLDAFSVLNNTLNNGTTGVDDDEKSGFGGDRNCNVQVTAYKMAQINDIGSITQESACNTILLNLYEMGTVSKAIKQVTAIRAASLSVILGTDVGQTNETFPIHFSIGAGIGQVKFGGLFTSESIQLYNELTKLSRNPFGPTYAGTEFSQPFNMLV